MKEDKDYGSIIVGKVADILVVGGKPAEHVSDLQKIETVIRGGRYYKISDLLLATGTRNGVRTTGAQGAAGDDGCGAHMDP
jgi:hypothetical protein